ncbi:hypothetical protein ONZ45_g2722 [Pleurotus djamor]|nr:hypothetical protein ONZ45_g2722 [Pleurotus djamor]
MSAYGKIARSSRGEEHPLGSTLWNIQTSTPLPGQTAELPEQSQKPSQHVSIHHLTLETALRYRGLVEYLHETFAQVVEEGFTYPQEGDLSRDAFESYFFAGDVFVGITPSVHAIEHGASSDILDGQVLEGSMEEVVSGRDWADCVAGFYYIKPNYPGRSSHICNAGFVVPTKHRGRSYGGALARSYVYYAPKLGYQASVFNLVYVNNVASVRPDGHGEHYVDAHVFYKSFIEDSGRVGV